LRIALSISPNYIGASPPFHLENEADSVPKITGTFFEIPYSKSRNKVILNDTKESESKPGYS
jgi:hypothetical protein